MRQSVPALPGWLTQLPSARRRMRPGQRNSAPLACAASSRSTRAARNPLAWFSRSVTPGVLSSAIPRSDAQAAVCRSDSPPGPRARAIRSSPAPSTTSRRRVALDTSRKPRQQLRLMVTQG